MSPTISKRVRDLSRGDVVNNGGRAMHVLDLMPVHNSFGEPVNVTVIYREEDSEWERAMTLRASMSVDLMPVTS